MKLLFDHNLSPQLVIQLVDIFPESEHVAAVNLEKATDARVWEYAVTNKCIIISKDSDFNDYSAIFGFPPKVIWIRLGNCTTAQAEKVLRSHQEVIVQFANDSTVGLLTIGK